MAENHRINQVEKTFKINLGQVRENFYIKSVAFSNLLILKILYQVPYKRIKFAAIQKAAIFME